MLILLALMTPLYTYTRERLHPVTVQAAAGINHQISFQGKLVNPDGTNVTDGSYSIVFSIYTVASAGSAIWTETQSVTLSNGIFQVNLGSVTTLPGSIDFNTDNIYLGIKVGADAEMTPRVQFTAVPQAFNAEKLGGLDKTGFIQNSTSLQSTANLYIQSGAVGNVTAKFRALASQTADILQVRDSGDTTTVFAVSPSGTITAGTWNGAVVGVAYGGTGLSSYTTGDLLYASGATTLSKLAAVASGSCLISQGVSTAPAWGTCNTGALVQVPGSTTQNTITPTAASVVGLTVNGTSGTAATALSVAQTGAATAMNVTTSSSGTGIAVTSSNTGSGMTIALTNTAGTQAAGLSITRNGAGGTTTDLLNLTNTAGTATNAITIAGTFTNILNTPTVDINNAGVITGATGLTSSGTITFSGLNTAGIVTNTAGGVLGTTATVPVANGGTGLASYTIGDLIYASGATTLSKLAAVATGSCLISQGVSTAPIWGACGTSNIVQVPGTTAQNTITPTAASVVGLTVNGTSGTAATALSVVQAGAATALSVTTSNTGTGLAITSSNTGTGAAISLTNTAGTQAAGFSITRNGAGGTTTDLLNLTNTAGTATNAIKIVGTFTNIFASPTVNINNAGAISGATGLSSSGTITFSGLSTAGIVTNTAAGVLGTTATVPVANGGTGLSSYTIGDLLYASGATTIAKLADVATGSCLISGGVGVAPSWSTACLTTVGAYSTTNTAANGATVSGSSIIFQDASATAPGMVGTGTQTFAGNKTFNGSVTVAASQSIRLIGGITGTRPASPTEGMLYYDTTTHQLLQYNGTTWMSDRSPATKIIAPSNASQAAKDSADVVLTGTADQTLINTALTAAAGGKVYILEGTVTITGSISIPNNTTLAGAGAGTLITIPNALNANLSAMINTDQVTGTNVTVQDLRLDGNKAAQAGAVGMAGIDFNAMGSGAGSSATQGARIQNIQSNNWYNNTGTNCQQGIGICLRSSANSIISGNTVQGNANMGFYLLTGSNTTITGNTAQGNTVVGIMLNSSVNNTITGNTTQGNASRGIYLGASSRNTITGNTTQGNDYGIQLFFNSNNNTITGNTALGNNINGILVNTSSNANTISGNTIYDNGGATTNNGIYVSDSDNNSISSNSITDTSATTNNFAINIFNSTSDTNYLSDNTLGGGSINDAGTGTIYGGQLDGTNNYTVQPAGIIELQGVTQVKPLSTSSTAFQVLNTAGNSPITVSTAADSLNLITNPGFEINTTGWALKGSASIARSTAQHYFGQASLAVTTTALANDGAKFPLVLSANTQYSYYFDVYAAAPITGFTYGYSADGSTEATYVSTTNLAAGWNHVYMNFTTPVSVNAGAYFFVKQSDATARTFYIDDVEADTKVFGSLANIVSGGYVENVVSIGGASSVATSLGINTTNPVGALEIDQKFGQMGFVLKGAGMNNLNEPLAFSIWNGDNTLAVSYAEVVRSTTFRGGSSFWNSAALQVNPIQTGAVGLRVTGMAGQTADLIQARNSSNKNVFSVGSAGDVKIGSAGIMPTITTSVKSTSSGTFAAKVDYTSGTNPLSITNADFNGDGRPDIAQTNFASNTVSIFINNGNGTFAAKVDYATGTGPYGVTTADFNGDGKPDLAVANQNSTTMSVFTNNGNGTFATKVDYTTGSLPNGITSADFNGDGKPDIAVTNNGSITVSVFINSGTGTFAAKVDYTTGTNPIGIASADFNGDGKPDLAVTNAGSTTMSVFINSGTGTFAAKVDYTTGTTPRGVTAADFNNDGKPDIAVANNSSTSVSVFINNGTGTFAAKVDYTTGATSAPQYLTSADFNADGFMDLAVNASTTNKLSIFINNGNGTFAAKVDYTTVSGPVGMTSGDFNGDGFPDIAGTGTVGATGTIMSVFMNNVSSGFSNSTTTQVTAKQAIISDAGKVGLLIQGASTTDNIFQAQNSTGQLLASLDGKGSLTVGGGPVYQAQLSVDGHVSFASKVDSTTGTGPDYLASADFNGDGKPDLAVGNYNAGAGNTLSIFLNNGTGLPGTASSTPPTNSGPEGIATADFNGDGKPDLAVANKASNVVSIQLNSGTGTFNTVNSTPATGTSPRDITSADFNGDGKPDLAVANSGSTSMSVFLNTGTGTFGAKADSTTGSTPYGITSADFNGDGYPDIAVTNFGGTTVSIFLNTGSGTFPSTASSTLTAGTSPQGITSADFNGDGYPDIAVTNNGTNTMSVFLNTGTGTFGAKSDTTTVSGPEGITSADFNGDGKTDLAVTNYNGGAGTSMSIFVGKGDGTFAAKVDYTTGTSPWDITSADFNGDGKPDLVVANNASTSASVFLNTSTSIVSPASKGTLSVTTADSGSGGLYIQGVANQTADYINIQNSTGSELFNVNSTGIVSATNEIKIKGTAGNGLSGISITSNSGATTKLLTADSTFTATSGWASNTILSSTGAIMLVPNADVAPVAGIGLTVDTTGDVQIQGTSSYGGYNLAVTSPGGVAAFNTTNAGAGATVVAFLQSGTVQGTVSINGATTSYNAFTGSHYAKIDSGSLNRGELASLTGNNAYAQGAGEPVYGITKTTTANDPNVLGAFLGLEDSTRGFSLEYPYLVMAAGNGDMWIADNGTGNVNIGDPLISSTVAGHAMRDPKTFAVSHVFAKSAEAIDWASVTQTVDGVKVAKISVLFSYYDADNTTVNLQAGTLDVASDTTINGDLNVSGVTTLADLTVTGDTSVGGNLTVAGDVETRNITVNGHIISAGDTPQVIVGQGAGAADLQNNIAAPVVSVVGNDTSGTITITTGAGTLADELAHINFATSFGGKPRVVLTPANRESSQINAYYDAAAAGTDGFSIFANNLPASNTTYSFTYFVVQ